MEARALSQKIEKEISTINSEDSSETPTLEKIIYAYASRKAQALVKKYQANREILTDDHVLLSDLNLYLQQIWSIIANTNLAYTNSPHSKLSRLNVFISQQLSKIFQENYLFLLIPSIEITDYDIIGMNLEDANFALHEFILSTDNKAIIPVVTVLEYGKSEAKLNHLYSVEKLAPNNRGNTVTKKIANPLNEDEMTRLIYHSEISQKFWHAVLNRIKIYHSDQTYGFMIRKLIQGLSRGDVRNHGSEFNSHICADAAIVEFSEWLNSLPLPKQKFLLDQTLKVTRFDSSTFNDLWNRLTRPLDSNLNGGRFCISLIGDHLQEFLNDNPNLDNHHPFDSISANSKTLTSSEKRQQRIERANKRVERLFDKLCITTEKGCQVTSSYGGIGSKAEYLQANRIFSIEDLSLFALDELSALFSDKESLAYMLKILAPDHQYLCLNHFSETLAQVDINCFNYLVEKNKDTLVRDSGSWSTLEMMANFSLEKKIIFIEAFKEIFSQITLLEYKELLFQQIDFPILYSALEILNNADHNFIISNFIHILRHYPIELTSEIAGNYFDILPQALGQGSNLRLCAQQLNAEKMAELMHCISSKIENFYGNNKIEAIATVIHFLPTNSCEDFMRDLTQKNIIKYIENSKEFNQLIDITSKEKHIHLVNGLGSSISLFISNWSKLKNVFKHLDCNARAVAFNLLTESEKQNLKIDTRDRKEELNKLLKGKENAPVSLIATSIWKPLLSNSERLPLPRECSDTNSSFSP